MYGGKLFGWGVEIYMYGGKLFGWGVEIYMYGGKLLAALVKGLELSKVEFVQRTKGYRIRASFISGPLQPFSR